MFIIDPKDFYMGRDPIFFKYGTNMDQQCLLFSNLDLPNRLSFFKSGVTSGGNFFIGIGYESSASRPVGMGLG